MNLHRYQQQFKFRRIRGPVTVFHVGANNQMLRRMVRQMFPEFGAQEHRLAAAKFKDFEQRLQCLYEKALDDAAIETFGRKLNIGEFHVSGIGRAEFPDAKKNRLRRLTRLKSQCQDIARAHAVG